MSEFSSKDYANGYRDGTQSAEATITALRAENERLRAALEDIAYPNPDHGEDQLMQIARAALEEKTNDHH